MTHQCDFLSSYDSQLHTLSTENEKLLFVNTDASIVFARKFLESLVKQLEEDYSIDPFGLNLKQRIEKLLRKGAFKEGVYERMEHIRSKGNKSAHEGDARSLIEALQVNRCVYTLSKWYVTKHLKKEIEIAPYTDPKPSPAEIDKDEIKAMFEEYMQTMVKEPAATVETPDEEAVGVQLEPLPTEESYLKREISRLKASSKEALENPGSFNYFKKYLHVEREIQSHLVRRLELNRGRTRDLILLVGSVGDGKSHLLSHLIETSDLLSDYEIINDATESATPGQTSIESLLESLNAFSDDAPADKKIILAINLGVLNNFIHDERAAGRYQSLIDFVHSSNLLSNETRPAFERQDLAAFNFAAHQAFELVDGKIDASYFKAILSKITAQSDDNPFFVAYNRDHEKNLKTIVHVNYELLMSEQIRNKVAELVARAIIMDKNVVSTRTYLNFISDLLIPDYNEDLLLHQLTENKRLELSFINKLFTSAKKSSLLNSISHLDPMLERTEEVDHVIETLNTNGNLNQLVNEVSIEEPEKLLFSDFAELFQQRSWIIDGSSEEVSDLVIDVLTTTLIRLKYLNDKLTPQQQEQMDQFVEIVYFYNRGERKNIAKFMHYFKDVIFKWCGSPSGDYIYTTKPSDTYRVAQELVFKPLTNVQKANPETVLKTFSPVIHVQFQGVEHNTTLSLEIDYTLYALLNKVSNGYRPTAIDVENGLSFVQLIEGLCRTTDDQSSFIIHHHEHRQMYKLASEFGDILTFKKL